jgi:hypothetical protein
MDQFTENMLPKNFIDGLADIPAMPQHLYTGIRHKINRKRAVVRAVWAVAASLVISLTAFQMVQQHAPRVSYVPEAAEELSAVDSYFNSSVYKENENSYAYYEETLYQE